MRVTASKTLKGPVNEVLAVAIGIGLGCCCLAFIGAPLLVTVLWIGRYAGGHSSADLTLPFLGFGFGFAASVASLAVRTSGIFDGTAGSGSVYWFGFWFLVGCVMTCISAFRLVCRLSIVNRWV
jgi:hypothetical protein